jgi:hypothetical protein
MGKAGLGESHGRQPDSGNPTVRDDPRRPEQREKLRFLRHRAVLVRERTRLACRIHAQLQQSRVLIEREKLLRKQTREWVETEAWPRLTAEQRALVSTHFELIDALNPWWPSWTAGSSGRARRTPRRGS